MGTNFMTQSGERARTDGATAVDQLRDVASNVKEELNRAGKIASNVTKKGLDELSEVGSEQIDRVGEFVRQRPVTALLIGGAVGFFAALLYSRR